MTLLLGDCLEVMAGMDAGSVDAVVTDPPYHLTQASRNGSPRQNDPATPFGRTRLGSAGFMGKTWDGGDIANRPETWAEALRVLKPSHYLLAFGGTRTWHRLACAIEDAGFEIRDTLMWLYGCLSDDTEVLVDGEWEPYHKATAGRRALCYNQEDETYSWQPISELLVYPYDDTAYRLHSDHTDQLVTRNHRCLVERGGGYVFEYAEEAARQREARVPVLEDVQGLLDALPVPQRDSGGTELDLFTSVSRDYSTGAQDDGAEARHGGRQVRRVRDDGMEAESMAQAGRRADVLASVQRNAPGARVGEARAQGPGGMDAGERGQPQREDDWAEQSGVERWSHHLPQARELLGRAVRALSTGVRQYGAQGWLCDGTPAVCSAGVGATTPALGSGASRRPRSDEQHASQPHAVRVEPRPQTVGASRFTTASLAGIEPVHYAGTVWCLRVPTGAFVARRNGKVFVTGNSGFPKGKACLKPAYEPVILARKPGPMRELGIEECRVESDRQDTRHGGGSTNVYGEFTDVNGYALPSGRWPANPSSTRRPGRCWTGRRG